MPQIRSAEIEGARKRGQEAQPAPGKLNELLRMLGSVAGGGEPDPTDFMGPLGMAAKPVSKAAEALERFRALRAGSRSGYGTAPDLPFDQLPPPTLRDSPITAPAAPKPAGDSEIEQLIKKLGLL